MEKKKVLFVCDEASGARCPIYPGKSTRLHWNFEDPSTFKGTDEEIRERIRRVRNEIKARIKLFIKECGDP